VSLENRIIPPGEVLPAMGGPTMAEAVTTPKRTPGKRRDTVRRRFGLLNSFLDRALPELGRIDMAAWLLLYRHAKPDGTVTASVADLARRAGCCERAMR